MAKNRELSGRIGRFKGLVGKNKDGSKLFKIEIIHSPSNQFYRVYNPGKRFNSGEEKRFRINFGSTQVVPASSSFDFFPSENVEIANKIAVPADDSLEQARGLYDVIGGDRESPSGRFDFANVGRHMVVNFTLAPPGHKAHYRFLNSGINDLKIFVGGSEIKVRTGESLKNNQSVDVVVSNGNNIEVKCDASPCKGVYELLRVWKE